MLTEDQAATIRDLAVMVLGFDHNGDLAEVPPGFDLAEVADALAAIEAEKDGAGGRALVLEFLGRIGPDLRAAAIDAATPASAARLAAWELAVADILRALGGSAPSSLPQRWAARRGDATLDLPGWIPLEVLDALARIAAAVTPGWDGSVSVLASEVENRLALGRRHQEIVEATGRLLAALDPEFDGNVTATAVELATRGRGDPGGALGDEAVRAEVGDLSWCAEAANALSALALVEAERDKQRGKWGDDHDDEHDDGALRVRAAELLVHGTDETISDCAHERDGWGLVAKHGDDELRSLVVASALVLAEIERILRACHRLDPGS